MLLPRRPFLGILRDSRQKPRWWVKEWTVGSCSGLFYWASVSMRRRDAPNRSLLQARAQVRGGVGSSLWNSSPGGSPGPPLAGTNLGRRALCPTGWPLTLSTCSQPICSLGPCCPGPSVLQLVLIQQQRWFHGYSLKPLRQMQTCAGAENKHRTVNRNSLNPEPQDPPPSQAVLAVVDYLNELCSHRTMYCPY